MKQYGADIIVVAGGSAGMAAAVAAAEKGASVIVFEKAGTTGGMGNFAHGPLAIESRIQKSKGIIFTKEEAFKIHMDVTHWQGDARLIRAYYEKTASTIDWLMEKGVEFSEIQTHGEGNKPTWHVVKTPSGRMGPGGSASYLIKALTEEAERLGVRLFLKTAVKKILKNERRITGVIAEERSGKEFRANGQAVIIATGGFVGNKEMLKEYTDFTLDEDLIAVRDNRNLSGDGIHMAWEVGAARTLMNIQMAHGIPGMEFMPLFQHPELIVNLLGERFVNEEAISNTTFFGNALARQKKRLSFMVMDENTKRYYQESGPKEGPFGKIDIDADLQKAIEGGNKNVFIADSIEELCGQTGIDQERLKHTLDEYNKACEMGRDDLFFKKAENIRPIKQPRFYAGRILPHALGTLGGIRINHKTEVLDKNLDVIPGLYAGGVDANSIYGDSYPWIMSGNTFGFAINSGRMAGENAVDYVNSIKK